MKNYKIEKYPKLLKNTINHKNQYHHEIQRIFLHGIQWVKIDVDDLGKMSNNHHNFLFYNYQIQWFEAQEHQKTLLNAESCINHESKSILGTNAC